MRGSAAFRSAIAPGGVLAGPWVQNELWRRAKAKPSLDLRFAENKSLVDATTGQNLVTFTRASSATYVDSTGTIQRATTNLLLRSEEFDNASWTKVRASVNANTIAAPNGTLTADTGVEDASVSATHNPLIQDAAIVANGIYTASLYVRAKERSRGSIWFSSTDSVNYVAGDFNLNTGTITASNAGTGSGASAKITNVGGGWYRVSVSGSIGGSLTTGRLVLRLADNTGSIVYTGDGTSGLFIWGAQLEQSSTVGDYVPTTSTINSAPRFDHNPTTGESLGLLVEEQRSNLCLQSEAFGTSPWAASNVTVTANTATSPAATLTADTLAATSANGTVTQPVTTTAVAMTFSVYLKRKTGIGNIDITADGSTWVTQTINSSTWTRCIVTQTAIAGTSNPGIRIVTSGDEIYAWGGQYE